MSLNNSLFNAVIESPILLVVFIVILLLFFLLKMILVSVPDAIDDLKRMMMIWYNIQKGVKYVS